jgi:hypothetical protein
VACESEYINFALYNRGRRQHSEGAGVEAGGGGAGAGGGGGGAEGRQEEEQQQCLEQMRQQ